MTPYQVVIVASLIEKEVSVPEEGPKVAAVIYNRLAAKMSLGIDATVRYALKKWTGPLTKSDLEVDSPYNTRKVLGLPPSPIASPGLAALQAALHPAKTNDLYYVLQATTGQHLLHEHLRRVPQAPRTPLRSESRSLFGLPRPSGMGRGVGFERASSGEGPTGRM